MRRIAVGDVMTRKVISVETKASLFECAQIMAKEGINSLLIVNGKKLVGILTARDVLKAITKNSEIDLKKKRGIDFASKKIAVIKPSADISQAIEKMRNFDFRRLPVIANGELVGVITLKDILSVEPHLYAETKHLMDEIREFDFKAKQSGIGLPLEGLCDNCGALSELLRVEGKLICPDCRDEMY